MQELSDGEIMIVYQPVIGARTARVILATLLGLGLNQAARADCPVQPAAAELQSPLRLMVHVSTKGLFSDPHPAVGMGSVAPQQGVSPAANLAGALITALVIRGINASRRHSMLEARTQIKGLLDRRNLSEEWRTALLRRVSSQPWLANATAETVSDPLDLEQPSMLVRISESTIVTLETRLLLEADATRAQAVSAIRVWRRQDHATLYCRNLVVLSEALPAEQAAEHWLGNDGEQLSKFVASAAEQTLWLLAMDRGVSSPNSASGETTVAVVDPVSGKAANLAIALMEETENRIVGRAKFQSMEAIVSIPKSGASNERSLR